MEHYSSLVFLTADQMWLKSKESETGIEVGRDRRREEGDGAGN